jgi:hypothetical protein
MIVGNQISKGLLDALGLPEMTRGFTLRCFSGEIVTVECEYYPHGSFETALAQYTLTPRAEPRRAAPIDFDAWMKARTDHAHRDYMQRISSLPAGRDRRPPSTEEIARYHGISHGGID